MEWIPVEASFAWEFLVPVVVLLGATLVARVLNVLLHRLLLLHVKRQASGVRPGGGHANAGPCGPEEV